MMCPKCESEDLLEHEPGISPLMDDGVDVNPEDTFVVLRYVCPKCGIIHIFYDYTRTENEDGEELHYTGRIK